MVTLEQLEHHLNALEARALRAEVRYEALVRYLMKEEKISMEGLQKAVADFQTLNNAVLQIKEINSITDKINAAAVFNKTASLKIYADDLGIRNIIEQAGGTSDSTARAIFSKSAEVPMTESFIVFMRQFIDPTKTPSPDVKIPDQVISPQ